MQTAVIVLIAYFSSSALCFGVLEKIWIYIFYNKPFFFASTIQIWFLSYEAKNLYLTYMDSMVDFVNIYLTQHRENKVFLKAR